MEQFKSRLTPDKYPGLNLVLCLMLFYLISGCTGNSSSDTVPGGSTQVTVTTLPNQTGYQNNGLLDGNSDNDSAISVDIPTATLTLTPAPTVIEVTMTATSPPAPTATPTLNQPIATPIPTLLSELPVVRPASTFAPIENSAQYLVVSSNEFLWHPDQQTAIPFPYPAWHFSGQPWSPDGQYLATGEFNGRMGIFTLATGELEILENIPEYGGPPSWSPDGHYLFYISGDYGNGRNPRYGVIYDLEIRQPILEFGPVVFIASPGWSFDSQAVAFLKWEVDSEGNDQIVLEVVNIETNEHDVYENPLGNFWLGGRWSPIDNQLLLYGPNLACDIDFVARQFSKPIGGLDLLNLSTGEINRLRELPNKDECIHPGYGVGNRPWSPAGDVLTYVYDGRLCFFAILSATESCMEELHVAITEAGYESVSLPSWSPHGEWIAFFLRYPNQLGEYVSAIRPDGTDLRISTHTAAPGSLIWSPAQ